MKLERYGQHGEFIRIPTEIQMEGRKAAISRWVRKNPKEALKRLAMGKVAPEDFKVFHCALYKSIG